MNSILKFKECIHLPNEFVYWGNEYRLINAIHYYYEQPFFSVDISNDRVHFILQQELHMKKLSARCVPHFLKIYQKRIRMKIS